jgi:hypothetical protein
MTMNGQVPRLRASWEAPTPKTLSKSYVTVYLVDRPLTRSHHLSRLAEAEQAVKDWRKAAATLRVNPQYDNCSDRDDCAKLVYSGEALSSSADELAGQMAAMDVAITETGCRCIVLFENDLKRFAALYGTDDYLKAFDDTDHVANAFGRNGVISTDLFVDLLLLHELGHQSTTDIGPGLSGLPRRVVDQLNHCQQQELRADAFVGLTLREMCWNGQPRQRELAADTCLSLALHSAQLDIYSMVDKTATGLIRRYLDNQYTHHNYTLRVLTINAMMTGGNASSIRLLNEYLDTRDVIRNKYGNGRYLHAAPVACRGATSQ